jgi:hypothetical protein
VAPGARFCTHCGSAVTGVTPARPGPAITAPGIAVGALGVAALALVVWVIGGRGAAAVEAPVAQQGAVAPDISSMTPRERFTRLADRVQAALEAGDRAGVIQFLPMTEGAYSQLLPGDRDLDARFHIAMLRAQTGNPVGARAEVDTILAAEPDHLLAHYVRALLADVAGDTAAGRAARVDFARAYDAEIAKDLPEYTDHRPLLEQARQAASPGN